MADNNTTNRGGFDKMSAEKQRKIASQGGKASSAKQNMSELGKKGNAAQPTEAKRLGGEHSHQNS